MKIVSGLLSSVLFTSCANLPESITPVSGFDLNRYSGTWYEIVRLNHSFERGLEQVTATYSINKDGTVKVANRGYLSRREQWKNAQGKARFAGDATMGSLEVSFFGPFYAPYVIFELDQERYQYAFVASEGNTLWLLSRTPQVSDELMHRFVAVAEQAGYPVDELIYVPQREQD